MLVLSLVSRGGLALFLSILVAVPVYILMLLLLKTLTEEELLEILSRPTHGVAGS